MKDFDSELDDILNEMESGGKTIEPDEENQDLLEEFKNQNMILKGLVNESDRILLQTKEILATQDKIVEFSSKCTKDITSAMYKMLKTRFTMVVSEEASAELHNLFVKLEGDMYKMHEQFIKKYQDMIEQQVNSKSNFKEVLPKWFCIFIICALIMHIIEIMCLFYN